MEYALHDTEINKIVCSDKGIELHFENGVYFTDEKGKEMELSGACKMDITISQFDPTRIWEHITVTKIRKSKIKEIAFTDFLKLLENSPFTIYIDYYSTLGPSILLKGDCGKYAIELSVTETEKVEYILG